MSFPYLAQTTLKYKSPHATDLSFAKGETIRVTGPNPEDEDWLVGETLDGSRSGGFPKDFVVQIEGDTEEEAHQPPVSSDPASDLMAAPSSLPLTEEQPQPPNEDPAPPPMPISAPAPPSPKQDPVVLPVSSPASAPPVATSAMSSTPADHDDNRPQSMKERLAFFAAAQNKVAPPPPVKPKPATAGGLTWSQRQKLRQEQEAKEREAGGEAPTPASSSAPAPAAAVPIHPPTEIMAVERQEGSGMSASDALSSITKGQSLKERMAALQGAGAFGAPAEKASPPIPSSKPKVWKRPPAPPQPEDDEQGEAAEVPGEFREKVVKESGEGEEGGEPATEEGEETEEEKEKARRAAIAARMAKLGGRGPMGMMPPAKPVRKPTRETSVEGTSPSVEKTDPMPLTSDAPIETAPTPSEPASTSPPVSIKVPATPRRTAPPRRKGGAAASSPVAKDEASQQTSQSDAEMSGDGIEPPSQVMVADEEAPLPRSQEKLNLEREQEAIGGGKGGADGAMAAGIALMPVEVGSEDDAAGDEPSESLVGAVGSAGSTERGIGVVGEGNGEIVDARDEPQEIEDGLEEGGQEKDEIMLEAERGDLDIEEPAEEVLSPRTLAPIGLVPIHPPAESGPEVSDDDEEAPPPPPPRMRLGSIGKDEIELKHEHDEEVEAQEAADEEEEIPAPPPRRISMDRPLGPRPPPSGPRSAQRSISTEAKALPPPPVGSAIVPPRDEEEEERELQGEGDEEVAEGAQGEELEERETEAEAEVEQEEDEAPAPPPPRRQPSLPASIQTGLPALASPASNAVRSPTSPQAIRSPATSAPAPPVTTEEAEPASPTDAEETSRRSGIAARMAKLGGIKFGMPPPVFKKHSTASAEGGEGPMSPVRDLPSAPGDLDSPIGEKGEAEAQAPSKPAEEETEEDEATRKRATLARLRAGGALGFGMFNHGPVATEPSVPSREVEAEGEDVPTQSDEREDEENAPPLPPLPAGRPLPAQPEPEDDETPPPPPSGRPPVPSGRPSLPPIATGDEIELSSPSRQPLSPPGGMNASPSTPTRTPSFGKRPPVPSTEKRQSMSAAGQRGTPSSSIPEGRAVTGQPVLSGPGEYHMFDEPAILAMDHDFASSPILPPPPPPGKPLPPLQTQVQASPQASPRRSTSSASHLPRPSVDIPPVIGHPQTSMAPATRQASRQSFEPVSRPSLSNVRPGFGELQEAASIHGSKLIRAAKGMFDQGKKGYFGDGSPAGFVLVAMDNAQLPRPQQTWGQVIYEQEAGSILKRYDEPRQGDIAAFHDAHLKGKKGLSSYSQSVGSVEEPLVGIVAEFDNKNKHKLRILQVERGIPEEVSYRCDDLKSGRIVIYRPGC